jgi:iron complex outermembrane receptor protein
VMTIVDGSNLTSNAASSHIYGADADITAHATSELSVVAGLSVLHAKYESFQNAVIVEPAGGPGCMCGNATVTGVNLSGTTVPFAPRFTASLGPDYKKDVGVGTLDVSAYLYYTGSFGYDNRIVQRDYATLSARASFQPSNSKFSYYVWGKNLTSRRYFYSTFISNFGDMVTYAEPITFGAGARYAF